MTLREELSLAVDFSYPSIRAAYEKQFGTNLIDDDAMQNRIVEKLLLLGPHLQKPVKAESVGPRFTEIAQQLGEIGRRHFFSGELTGFPTDITIPGLPLLDACRFDRDNNVVKAWGPKTYDSARLRGFNPDEEACPKTRMILLEAVEALKTNASKDGPETLLSMFPRNTKRRRESAAYLVLSIRMRGHRLRVQGEKSSIDTVDTDRCLLVDPCWPSFQALNKDATVWTFAYADNQTGTGNHLGTAVITDGEMLLAGLVE